MVGKDRRVDTASHHERTDEKEPLVQTGARRNIISRSATPPSTVFMLAWSASVIILLGMLLVLGLTKTVSVLSELFGSW